MPVRSKPWRRIGAVDVRVVPLDIIKLEAYKLAVYYGSVPDQICVIAVRGIGAESIEAHHPRAETRADLTEDGRVVVHARVRQGEAHAFRTVTAADLEIEADSEKVAPAVSGDYEVDEAGLS